MRSVLALLALALAGCSTAPAPDALPVYQPKQPIHYPIPK